jgi:CRISPR-associated protein (TIGR03986 family)
LYGVVSISKTDPGGWVEGYVLIGEAFQSKHHDSVFIQGNRVANVRDEDYTRLKRVWRLYQTKKNGGVNESRSGGTYPGYLDADSLPVFYKEASAGSGRYYLSPACITKEVFDHTVKGILEKQGGYQPCDKKDDCCEACRLFGMVGDDENSLASRVMFRDALPITDSDWYGSTRRIILGSPKTTATEFYMEDPGFAMFNYDYGVNYTYRHNGSVSGKQLSPITNPRLRGRKFYWHSATQQDAPAGTNVNMTQEIRPVKHGISFTFTVAFDRVTEDELRKLKFALELAFNGESEKYAHKLGHGKPIGYGSVRIRADKVIIYEVCEDLRLTELPAGKIPDLLWRPKETFPVRELKRMLDWENKPENVQYPRTASSPSIYTWFGKNKSIENGSTHPQYTHILPYPLSQNPTLPDTIIRGGGNRNAVRLEKSSWITVSAPATKPAQPSISLDDVRLEFEEDKIIK